MTRTIALPLRRAGTAGLIATLFVLMFSVVAFAGGGDQVCTGLSSGKIDVTGPGAKTITITAPEGNLITGYCVKAGSEQQGNGPVYVELQTPVASLSISHPSGKDISHYSFSWVPIVTPSTTTGGSSSTSTTSVPTTTTVTTSPPTSSTTTTTVPSTTSTTSSSTSSTSSTTSSTSPPPTTTSTTSSTSSSSTTTTGSPSSSTSTSPTGIKSTVPGKPHRPTSQPTSRSTSPAVTVPSELPRTGLTNLGVYIVVILALLILGAGVYWVLHTYGPGNDQEVQ